jgi:hypothetical protein
MTRLTGFVFHFPSPKSIRKNGNPVTIEIEKISAEEYFPNEPR